MSKYDDIINMPHHVSSHRSHMSMVDRAAQFSPFASLKGYGSAIRETARLTEQKHELDETERRELDIRLDALRRAATSGKNPQVQITYFEPDPLKAGGQYLVFDGSIAKFRYSERSLVMSDGTVIDIDQVAAIDSPLFQNISE